MYEIFPCRGLFSPSRDDRKICQKKTYTCVRKTESKNSLIPGITFRGAPKPNPGELTLKTLLSFWKVSNQTDPLIVGVFSRRACLKTLRASPPTKNHRRITNGYPETIHFFRWPTLRNRTALQERELLFFYNKKLIIICDVSQSYTWSNVWGLQQPTGICSTHPSAW